MTSPSSFASILERRQSANLLDRNFVPFSHQHGSPILYLGEAPGESEATRQKPFIGPVGRLLRTTSSSLGLPPGSFENVFPYRPYNNQIDYYCYLPDEGKELKEARYATKSELLIGPSLYVREEFMWEAIERVGKTILEVSPKVVVALGNTAIWLCTGQRGVRLLNGSLLWSTRWPFRVKIMCCYHPGAVVKQWNLLPALWSTLLKAKHELSNPPDQISYPLRSIIARPNLDDTRAFIHRLIEEEKPFAFDIETISKPQIITCLSLSNSPSLGICIPFFDPSSESGSYWTEAQERIIVNDLRKLFRTQIPRVAHNSIYDVFWLVKKLRLDFGGPIHDTMLMHHALWPELPKGLKVVGPLHTNQPPWAQLHQSGRDLKKED